MSELKRYNPDAIESMLGCYCNMEQCDDGEYVLYSAHNKQSDLNKTHLQNVRRMLEHGIDEAMGDSVFYAENYTAKTVSLDHAEYFRLALDELTKAGVINDD